jgi:hypothetical protein
MAKLDKSLLEIDEPMELAINELLKGVTDEIAGKAAGVSRQTIQAWKSTHPAFRSELRNRRAAIWQTLQQSLTELHSDSIKTICKAVKEGDVSASKWVLERSSIEGVLSKALEDTKASTTTPEQELKTILHNMATEKANKKIAEFNRANPNTLQDFLMFDRLYSEEMERLTTA